MRGQLGQVGWVRFDGDEYHGFRYWSPEDRHLPKGALNGFLPVFVRAADIPGGATRPQLTRASVPTAPTEAP